MKKKIIIMKGKEYKAMETHVATNQTFHETNYEWYIRRSSLIYVPATLAVCACMLYVYLCQRFARPANSILSINVCVMPNSRQMRVRAQKNTNASHFSLI